MTKVFIGGSRHIARLPTQAIERLKNIIESGFPILVGDANGADKAMQRHLMESGYSNVTVYCSGDTCRNNLGSWPKRHIESPKSAKGFQFHAAKDREMALAANFGLMIWDGKSAGTLLNILRLVRAGKKAILLNVSSNSASTFRNAEDWDLFLELCASELRRDLKDRATPKEWDGSSNYQLGLLELPLPAPKPTISIYEDERKLAIDMNAALASGDPRALVELLGVRAKRHGMSQVAKDTGLAREGLYRALSKDGNPEFATVLKVMDSVGVRLMVKMPE